MTTVTMSIEIDSELFTGIGTMMATEANALSPFSATPEHVLDSDQFNQLHELGITTESGKLQKDWFRIFSVLNTAASLTSVRVSGMSRRIEWVFYTDPDGSTSVCVVQRNGMVSIAYPAKVDTATEWLCDALGLSAFTRAGIAIEIAETEALVLAVMIDARRHHCLQCMIGASTPEHVGLTPDEIVGMLNSDQPRPVGVLHVVRNVLPQIVSVPRTDVEGALAALDESGHVTVESGRYVASASVAAVADGLPVVQQLVSVTRATNASQDDSVEYSTFQCMQCGPHDVLCIEAADSTVRLETSSTAIVIARTRVLLEAAAQATSDVASWQPTHTIPPSGLDARQAPDTSHAVVATLDPLLEVAVVDRQDGWAQIVCSNHWAAWVDSRELRSIER